MEELRLEMYKEKYPLLVDESRKEVFVPYYTMTKVREEGGRKPLINFVKELKKRGYRKIKTSNMLKAAEANIYAERMLEDMLENYRALKSDKGYLRDVEEHAENLLAAGVFTGGYAIPALLLQPSLETLLYAGLLISSLYMIFELMGYDVYLKRKERMIKDTREMVEELLRNEYLATGYPGTTISYMRVIELGRELL